MRTFVILPLMGWLLVSCQAPSPILGSENPTLNSTQTPTLISTQETGGVIPALLETPRNTETHRNVSLPNFPSPSPLIETTKTPKENLNSPEFFGSFSSFIPSSEPAAPSVLSQENASSSPSIPLPMQGEGRVRVEPTLKVEDALDESTGLSVLAPTSNTGLQGDIQGRLLKLTLKGLFISPEPFKVVQSNGIEWTVTHSNPTTLSLERDTLNVVDFYLVGTHKFKITSQNLQQAFNIKIDRPLKSTYLYPVIQEVYLSSPQSLTITTKNACLNPRFQQLKLKNEIVPIGSVTLTPTGISTLEVPLNSSSVPLTEELTVHLITPFGSTFWKGFVTP